jgi:hypothetical protein
VRLEQNVTQNPYEAPRLRAEPIPFRKTWLGFALKLTVVACCGFVTFFFISTGFGGMGASFSGWEHRYINQNPYYWAGVVPGGAITAWFIWRTWRSVYWPVWAIAQVVVSIGFIALLMFIIDGPW